MQIKRLMKAIEHPCHTYINVKIRARSMVTAAFEDTVLRLYPWLGNNRQTQIEKTLPPALVKKFAPILKTP